MFSFAGGYVSSKRHRLSAQSLTRGMAVAFYSQNGMIKEGFLAKWKDGIQTAKKGKLNNKGKRKGIELDD